MTGREIAVAGMHNALDSGAFDLVRGFEPVGTLNTSKEHSATFQVLVPTPGSNGAAATNVTLTVNRHTVNVPDLFASVRANMQVPNNVPLGWQLSNNISIDSRLLTTCKWPSTQSFPAAAKPAKPTEMAYQEELTIVKDKFQCESTGHTHCYIPTSGPNVGYNILGVRDDCSVPANSLKFDELMKKQADYVNPTIHINLAKTPLRQVYHPQHEDVEHPGLGKCVREESPANDDPVIVPIDELLAELNTKMLGWRPDLWARVQPLHWSWYEPMRSSDSQRQRTKQSDGTNWATDCQWKTIPQLFLERISFWGINDIRYGT
ncbi:hypothetical protein GGX14DRAFT_398397 [Mycena pura]|uniref:Uncharacterized protein n=1 Tax=Mycena pura TaxID=153505 RepID=A0AAD6V6V4_9AGAR|nr:hypothetical protein GGX14DRAFT_398397 [Mycena pura]